MPARVVDVWHLGRPQVVGAWVVDDEVLIDPGPSNALGGLLEALEGWQPSAIALTHVHLDHAGVVGELVRLWPGIEVWVHPAGAPYLSNSRRLSAAARRWHGPQSDRLWGPVTGVPRDRLRVVADGEAIGALEAAYTPGHAADHVSYLHRADRCAFVGDAAGVRIGPEGPVLPPTVPSRVDLASWGASLQRIRAWQPSRLALTHFGAHDDVDDHLDAMAQGLTHWGTLGSRIGDAAFAAAMVVEIRNRMRRDVADAYAQAGQPHALWDGLARWSEAAAAAKPRASAPRRASCA